MKKTSLFIFLFLTGTLLFSQTECEFKFSFRLVTQKEKSVKKIRKQSAINSTYIKEYTYKSDTHFFEIGKIGYCEYEIKIKKRGKTMVLKFHNTKEFRMNKHLGIITLNDTTLHYYDGYRMKRFPASELKTEMIHPATLVPFIDSIVFYSVIMNDLPQYIFEGSGGCVISPTKLISFSQPNPNKGYSYSYKFADTIFNKGLFILSDFPIKYLDSTGNYGDCLVNLNQTSNYNCFTMIIYKSNTTQLILKGNGLPREIFPYYYKVLLFNNMLSGRKPN